MFLHKTEEFPECLYLLRIRSYSFLPLFRHAVHELQFGKFALCRCPELPGYEEDTYTGRVQSQVVTELLDPIDANLVIIMRI